MKITIDLWNPQVNHHESSLAGQPSENLEKIAPLNAIEKITHFLIGRSIIYEGSPFSSSFQSHGKLPGLLALVFEIDCSTLVITYHIYIWVWKQMVFIKRCDLTLWWLFAQEFSLPSWYLGLKMGHWPHTVWPWKTWFASPFRGPPYSQTKPPERQNIDPDIDVS